MSKPGPIKVECSNCGAGLKVAADRMGGNLRCPRCKQTFTANKSDTVEVPSQKTLPVRLVYTVVSVALLGGVGIGLVIGAMLFRQGNETGNSVAQSDQAAQQTNIGTGTQSALDHTYQASDQSAGANSEAQNENVAITPSNSISSVLVYRVVALSIECYVV